jgi:hypothetical protein
MRKILLCGAALALVGCGTTTSSYVKATPDATLGRVVVYRNGVAYYERFADVNSDHLSVNVPQDKVDDFLKSLTVIDVATGKPAPVSYPSLGTNGASGSGPIDMKISLPASDGKPHRLKLSYVTDAPAWKPSYRAVVGKDGKVSLQAWAVVDNTSGEDWNQVKLGVGSSSAMSFRFDLRSLRMVQRETLKPTEAFAMAPPSGGATFGNNQEQRLFADMSDESLKDMDAPPPPPVVAAQTRGPVAKAAAGKAGAAGGYGGGPSAAPMDVNASAHRSPSSPAQQAQAQAQSQAQVAQMAQMLRSNGNTVVVEGFANGEEQDKMTASLDRANKLRDQLIRAGVNPNQVVAMGKGEAEGRRGGARIVAAPPMAQNKPAPQPGADGKNGAAATTPEVLEPIGTSHFESGSTMSVPRGTSAMISIFEGPTDGQIVYLYDPESARGNSQFAFKTLRFKNPTDSALESGPFSVFGEGRFVGEGLAEPIPAKSTAFVPFALDRQIVVEHKDQDHDEIARIITVQRGVFSTEVQHTRKQAFTLYNRSAEKAVVYLRHTVPQGYKLTHAPNVAEGDTKDEHLGGARLFKVEVEPNAKTEVAIEEATPVFRTTDIRTEAGLELVRAYVNHAAVQNGKLKGELEHLIKLNADMAKVQEQIQTVHEQMGEYRARMDELHAQLVTLKAVKTAGPLMGHLEKKLQEVSERLSKATVDVVGLQEKLMVAKVEFQTGVSDLSLTERVATSDKP